MVVHQGFVFVVVDRKRLPLVLLRVGVLSQEAEWWKDTNLSTAMTKSDVRESLRKYVDSFRSSRWRKQRQAKAATRLVVAVVDTRCIVVRKL